LSLHHFAILGTTGTGKTHLAFAVVDALAAIGTRVICVDTTGQYGRRFTAAPRITIDDAPGFAANAGGGIAILDLGENLIVQGNRLATKLFDWAKSSGQAVDPDLPAKCVVLLEEAQNVVPEGFVVDDWNLKAKAQDTSLKIMESRKYALGFAILSQRTAMVTKSALSQCNTLFAFQAVDQTGLDYFEGLCGSTLARSVPTLPPQTAIAMGRALTSNRPIITRIEDATHIIT
jgi:DNA helicase HerA-like ATPase